MIGRTLGSPRLLLATLVATFSFACAARHASYQTAAAKDAVYRACIDAVSDVEYAVTSSDPATGLIVAEKRTDNGRASVLHRLNIMLGTIGDKTTVRVNYVVSPPDTLYDDTFVQGRLVKQLKARIPDIQVVQ